MSQKQQAALNDLKPQIEQARALEKCGLPCDVH